MVDVDVDGSAIWEWLRATRSDPPAPAAVTDDRRRTYTFALEQAEQMFRAASLVGPATRPLQVFYGLSQAGRAIAAASSAITSNDGWHLRGHGIHTASSTLSGPLRAVRVYTDSAGRAGSFVRMSEILSSSLWTESDALSFDALWDSLPENRLSPITDDTGSRRTPLYVEHRSMYPGQHPLVSAPVVGFPPSVVDADDPRQALLTYLAAYPGAAGYDSYVRTGTPDDAPPAFVRHEDGWGDLTMNWTLPDGHSGGPDERLAHLVTRTRSYQGSLYLFPALGPRRFNLHPLMAWWAVLYTLSMLARYEPSAWSSHINVDDSHWAVPLESLLNQAIRVVPRIVAHTILEVSQER